MFPIDQVSEYEHITEKRQLENLEKFSFSYLVAFSLTTAQKCTLEWQIFDYNRFKETPKFNFFSHKCLLMQLGFENEARIIEL